MWRLFRKKSKPPGAPPPNRVDELANTLQREGRAGSLEQELEKLDRSTLGEGELESWWHIHGILAFRAGRQEEATARFEEAHRRFPGSARIKFSLGQQCVQAHEIDRGFELFRSCVFPDIPRDYALMQVRYAYLWDRYEDGRLMLRPFLKAYKDLEILDDHFLHVRGLPFFGRWWSHLAALSILGNDTRELESVTEYVCRHCRDFDFEYLQSELAAYRDDQPQRMLPLLERRLEDARPGFPNGYLLMKRAVIRGRAAAGYAEAEAFLDGVELKENDFPWLADIRTLAKAELAHRHARPGVEAQRVEKFMARQAMLFEPDIALNFHLLRYQERLKPRYRAE